MEYYVACPNFDKLIIVNYSMEMEKYESTISHMHQSSILNEKIGIIQLITDKNKFIGHFQIFKTHFALK